MNMTSVTTPVGIPQPLTVSALTVSEIFGPTVQGEGPSTGQRCAFVRLGRCDLACAWCDTPYTWDWKGVNGRAYDPRQELEQLSIDSVRRRVEAMDVGLVVITGGEPMLQRSALTELVGGLRDLGLDVEIETNGRHAPIPVSGVRYNVSPKLASSGMSVDQRLRWLQLGELAAEARSVFKFVCSHPGDLEEVEQVIGRAEIPPHRVWISPLGTTPEQIQQSLRSVADDVISRGWNLSTRLHVLAWGDVRGR